MHFSAPDEDHPLLRHLNPAQREAVTHLDGPQLVLAGPGSGKTRVVTHRIAWLLHQGISPRQIVALTFTNKAADEMKARVAHLRPNSPVWISTFHRFCARLLRQYAPLVGLTENFSIYDTDDSQKLLRRVVDDLGLVSRYYTPEAIARAISAAKNRLIPPDRYEPRRGLPIASVVADVYPEYQKRLLASNAVDFDDLLVHVALLLSDNPEVRAGLDERYRYVLVDEYQDTNFVQYLIVRALSTDHPNLSVTGDPDQAIYSWRGANLGNILEFENDYPNVRVVRLEQNYRSTKRILRIADVLIANNFRRKAKHLFTENDDGCPVRLAMYPTQTDEARDIAARIAEQIRAGTRRPRDFAVFYRTNALSRELEHALAEQGIPYHLVNSVEFYQRREIKDVMAYLQLINNPRSDMAMLRVINTPPRGIGRTTVERLAEHGRRFGLTLLEAARHAGLIESLNKRAAVAVARFVALFDSLCEHAASPVEELLGHVLEKTGYADALGASQDSEDEDRLANIQELLTAAQQFDAQHPGPGALETFLEQASLVNDTDGLDGDLDRVSLMTIHSAKGLEFPSVYIVAVEQGLLPHERSCDDPDAFEEERRLLFVAITRARESLQLSLAQQRQFRGATRWTVPSPFLMELPRDEMESNLVGLPGAEAWALRRGMPREDASADQGGAWPPDEEWSDDAQVPADGAVYRATGGATDVFGGQTAAVPSVADGAAMAAKLTTASRLLNQQAAAPADVDADVFYQGMPVRHPEYGLGKIVALSGSGLRRTATVNFVTEPLEKKFVIVKSALRPAK